MLKKQHRISGFITIMHLNNISVKNWAETLRANRADGMLRSFLEHKELLLWLWWYLEHGDSKKVRVITPDHPATHAALGVPYVLFCHSYLTWHLLPWRRIREKCICQSKSCTHGSFQHLSGYVCVCVCEWGARLSFFCLWFKGMNVKSKLVEVTVTWGLLLTVEVYLWQSWLWTVGWKPINTLVLIVCQGIVYQEILPSFQHWGIKLCCWPVVPAASFLGVGKWELCLSLVLPDLLLCF